MVITVNSSLKKILGAYRPDMKSPPGTHITMVVHPSGLVARAVSAVSNCALRDFLESVVSEPEVWQSLTTPIAHGRHASPVYPYYAVQSLCRAGELASYWCALDQQERDVLFVATLLRGVQTLLSDYLVGSANLEDVLFTLARSALHELDESSPRNSFLLRLAMGWANVDEVDDYYVPRLQNTVQRALMAAFPDAAASQSRLRSESNSSSLAG